MPIEILPCTCEHKFQDKTYGKGQRVHNKMEKGGKLLGYRCTVCATKKGLGNESK